MAEERLDTLDRIRPFVLIASFVVGIAMGTLLEGWGGLLDMVIYYAVILLIYSITLGVHFGDVMHSFRNLRFFGLAWLHNFVIIPIIAWGLALLFLSGNPAIYVGVILYLVIPCTDWFLMFTAMAKGDVPLGLALLPTNLLIQILLLPVYLYLFAGEVIPFQMGALVETFSIFIFLPFALAWVTRWLMGKLRTAAWREKVLDRSLPPAQLLILVVIIFAMFAGQTDVILEHVGPLTTVFVPVVLFFLINFALAYGLSWISRLRYKEYALLTCTAVARNSPLGLAIAFGLFPDQPLV
ncbi:MAG: arsenic resistance protein [Thermoplasmatota archaeon]